jgi:hypothetical protein
MNHCQRDEVAQGLVWLAHGLEVVPEDEPELQLSFRRLLWGWTRHVQALKQILPIPSNFQIALSPDGKMLATGCDKPAGVQLSDAVTGKPLGEPIPQPSTPAQVAFSPDGRTIMTAGSETYLTEGVQPWDALTGRPLGKVLWTHGYEEWHTAGVSAVFSPNSRALLAKTTFLEHRPGLLGDVPFDEARLFEVPPPVQGDAARLRLWVEVITARELDAGGEIADLDAKTWQLRWQRLQKLGGPP